MPDSQQDTRDTTVCISSIDGWVCAGCIDLYADSGDINLTAWSRSTG